MKRLAIFGALLTSLAMALATLHDYTPATLEPEYRRITPKRGPQPDGPAEYVEWRNFSLRDETGAIAENGLLEGKAHVEMMRAAAGSLPAAGIDRDSWSSVGPGNVGGRVRTLAIHPTTPTTIFAGSVSGGIWKTTNGGATWLPVNDFMANLAVTAIVMAPGNPNVMYAATGEGFYNGDGLRGAGVFRSVDGGTTWIQLPATSTAPGAGQTAADFHYVNELAISPNGAAILLATRTGIFRSVDGGETFTRRTMSGGGAISVGNGIVDVDFHPADSTRAVAANFSGTSIYSVDGGVTWFASSGLPGGGTFIRSELTFARSNGNVVYAGVDTANGSLYRSANAGQTFTQITEPVSPYNAGGGSQGWYDNLLWVSPTDENFLIWGGIDLFRSTDGGTSWGQISRWQSHSFVAPTSAHADQHIAVPHPGYNGTTNRVVYFGNDGGVYRADDVATLATVSPFQAGWTELNNGLAITQFYGGAGHPASGRLTGGTQDNGTLFYDATLATPSENWRAPFGGDGGFSAYDSVDGNYFYGEYVYLSIHRNSTGGASPSAYMHAGLTDALTTASEFIAAFVKDPNQNNRLLGASVRLWRTNNAKGALPVGWEVIRNASGTNDKISAIAVAPGNSNIIYVGHAGTPGVSSSGGRIYKTVVGTSDAATVAASWTAVDDNGTTNPLPNRRVTRITIDPADVNVVYATFGGFSGDNVYKSVNGGVSWTDITGPSGGAAALPDVPVRDLEVHPTNSNWIYAGTEVGIFASENGGATWVLPHDGPANVSVDELFFLNTTLHAVTHGRGMFRTPTTPTAPSSANDAYAASTGVTLTIAAPGVLANDASNVGAMQANLVSTTAQGALMLDPSGGFSYTPNPGFTGADTFTYRASNSAGSGNVATVTITVSIPTGPLPPTGLHVASVVGSRVTLRWTRPTVGTAPTAYVVKGGINPGEVLAAFSTGSTDPIYIFNAPTGAFRVRVHTVTGASESGPSNEVRLFVNSSQPPSAPAGLTAMVNGSTLALSWTNTFEGGAPTGLVLDVSGSLTVSLPLRLSERFAFAGVPPGAYALRLRATNAGGSSGQSNAVDVTSPGACSGVPQTPLDLLATHVGRDVTVRWSAPPAGAAPTEYVLEATGAFVGRFVTSERSLTGRVGPGSYTLRVRAGNACGAGPFTVPVTIVVR